MDFLGKSYTYDISLFAHFRRINDQLGIRLLTCKIMNNTFVATTLFWR